MLDKRRKEKKRNTELVTGKRCDELGMIAAGLFLSFTSFVK